MIIINSLINTRSNILYKDTSQPRISFTGGVRSNVLERTGVSDVFTSSKITKKDVSALNKTAALYPQDVYYKKNLLINMGENPKNIYRLNSIAGPQEFTKFMEKFNDKEDVYKPGSRPLSRIHEIDSHGMENVDSGLYGANMHIHSVHSDGQLTVREILNQAVEYADKRIEKNGVKEPFYLSITDHNTAEGAKEALNIIYDNPKKYQNLRLVLGAEISAKMPEIRGFQFKKPRTVHIMAMCSDPNSKVFDNFIKSLSEESKNVMFPKFITLEEIYDTLKNEKSIIFGFAHPAFPDMRDDLKSSNRHKAAVLETIQHFINVTKEKGIYVEGHYQGYKGEIAKDKKLLKLINRFCDYLGLLKSGGMDTHMYSIFQSGKRLRLKK